MVDEKNSYGLCEDRWSGEVHEHKWSACAVAYGTTSTTTTEQCSVCGLYRGTVTSAEQVKVCEHGSLLRSCEVCVAVAAYRDLAERERTRRVNVEDERDRGDRLRMKYLDRVAELEGKLASMRASSFERLMEANRVGSNAEAHERRAVVEWLRRNYEQEAADAIELGEHRR
jgi:hypothetical protein